MTALEFRQLSQVLADIHVHHVDYADLYFQYSRLESWSLEEGIVKSGSFNIEQGVGVRAISGEKTAFAYSDEISFDAPDKKGEHVKVDADYVRKMLADIVKDQDLSRYIL